MTPVIDHSPQPKLPHEYVEQGWCQGAYAKSASGNGMINPESEDACQWCLLGAIMAYAYHQTLAGTPDERLQTQMKVKHVVYKIVDKWQNKGATAFNDSPETTQEQVVAVLLEAERRLGLLDPEPEEEKE